MQRGFGKTHTLLTPDYKHSIIIVIIGVHHTSKLQELHYKIICLYYDLYQRIHALVWFDLKRHWLLMFIPELCPNMVTFLGSPPNPWMFL